MYYAHSSLSDHFCNHGSRALYVLTLLFPLDLCYDRGHESNITSYETPATDAASKCDYATGNASHQKQVNPLFPFLSLYCQRLLSLVDLSSLFLSLSLPPPPLLLGNTQYEPLPLSLWSPAYRQLSRSQCQPCLQPLIGIRRNSHPDSHFSVIDLRRSSSHTNRSQVIQFHKSPKVIRKLSEGGHLSSESNGASGLRKADLSRWNHETVVRNHTQNLIKLFLWGATGIGVIDSVAACLSSFPIFSFPLFARRLPLFVFLRE